MLSSRRRTTQISPLTSAQPGPEDYGPGEVGAWLDERPPSVLRAPVAAVRTWAPRTDSKAA